LEELLVHRQHLQVAGEPRLVAEPDEIEGLAGEPDGVRLRGQLCGVVIERSQEVRHLNQRRQDGLAVAGERLIPRRLGCPMLQFLRGFDCTRPPTRRCTLALEMHDLLA